MSILRKNIYGSSFQFPIFVEYIPLTQGAALTMAAIPTTSPAPGHAGGGVKVSSEPERGERRGLL